MCGVRRTAQSEVPMGCSPTPLLEPKWPSLIDIGFTMTKTVTPVHSGTVQNNAFTDLRDTGIPRFPMPSAQRVALRDILRDNALQVRTRVDPRTVRHYAEAMQAGAEFPPIKLARIDNSLYLVDGWVFRPNVTAHSGGT